MEINTLILLHKFNKFAVSFNNIPLKFNGYQELIIMEILELTDKLSKMSITDRNKFITGLEKDCICHECPTYNTCTRKSKELLFCISGKSRCPIHERICLCPKDCSVYQRYNLKFSFYCSKGKEIERQDELYTLKI